MLPAIIIQIYIDPSVENNSQDAEDPCPTAIRLLKTTTDAARFKQIQSRSRPSVCS
jgi:hypothetical protein